MSAFDASRPTVVRALPTANKAFVLGACLALATAALQGGRPALVLHRTATIQAEADRMMAEAMRPGRDGTCFGSQLAGRADGARIAAATVLVAITDAAGKVVSAGTGTVVAGSGQGGAPNRLLTAEHVVAEARGTGGEKVIIAGSDGRFLAIAKPRDPPTLAPDAPEGTPGDMAVLVPVSFPPGGEAAYRAIQGLEIAQPVPGRAGGMTGLAGLPAGIDHGASGAAILDGEGSIRGIVTSGAVIDPSLVRIETVRFTSGDIMAMAMAKDGAFRTAERSLPGWGSFKGEAIPPALAASLSPAPLAGPSGPSPAGTAFQATVAGYPGLSCVVYEAIVSTVGPDPVTDQDMAPMPGR